MRVDLRGYGIDLTPDLRSFAHRRLHFALGRFGASIRRADVRVYGGRTSGCSMTLSLTDGTSVHAEAADVDLHAALHAAAQRLARSIGRLRDRARLAS
jgi:ribosomal subunit interface protein